MCSNREEGTPKPAEVLGVERHRAAQRARRVVHRAVEAPEPPVEVVQLQLRLRAAGPSGVGKSLGEEQLRFSFWRWHDARQQAVAQDECVALVSMRRLAV